MTNDTSGAEPFVFQGIVPHLRRSNFFRLSIHALTDVAIEYRPFGPKVHVALETILLSGTNESSFGLVQTSLRKMLSRRQLQVL